MKKQNNFYIEFGIVSVLIIAAIIFGYNVKYNAWRDNLPEPSNAPSATTAPAEPAAPQAPASPEMAKWNDGKSLFRSNCAACHSLKNDGVGPALAGVEKTWHDAGSYKGKTGDEWLRMWIKNWNDPVKAGYPFAVNMANSRPAQMNVFATLSDKDIDLLLYYIGNPDGVKPAS